MSGNLWAEIGQQMAEYAARKQQQQRAIARLHEYATQLNDPVLWGIVQDIAVDLDNAA